MKELENLLRERKLKKFRLGLTEADQKWEPTMVSPGAGKTSFIKNKVTNVEQSKGAGATKEMMREEREDYEENEGAKEAYERALMEAEIERRRKQR